MLDGRRDDAPASAAVERLGGAAEGEVVGFGTAAREDDFGRLGADQRRDRARASSSAALARCPNAWTLDGLPKVSRGARATASTTSGATGVVAL